MLICKLAKNDREAQEFICDSFEFTPFQGKVSVNQMPPKVEDEFTRNPKLLLALRTNHEDGKSYWCYPPVKNNTTGNELIKNFPDPAEYWIGFYLGENKRSKKDTVTTPNGTAKAKVSINLTQSIKEPPQLSINKLPVSSIKSRGGFNALSGREPLGVKSREEVKQMPNKKELQIASFDDALIDDIEPERPTNNGAGNAFKYRFSTSSKPIASLIKDKISKAGVSASKGGNEQKEGKQKAAVGKANYNPAKYATKTKKLTDPQTHPQPKPKPQAKIQDIKKYAQCFKSNTTRDSYKKPQIKAAEGKGKNTFVKSTNKKYKKEVGKPTIYMRNCTLFTQAIDQKELLNFIGAARGSVGQTVNHDSKANKDLALTKEKESARVQSGSLWLIGS
eukprot:TRINITY_DN3264_c0_g1_i4.p1 TRINITY_DN3264_c0_g1~~TRINITY_DN3264_c0_g1_i4.p1  ORF type:complete len:391 (+),score=111.39 TRINITY_DN3264_c0_g1_i4:408-1580(+)